jgi:hypothetical protein
MFEFSKTQSFIFQGTALLGTMRAAHKSFQSVSRQLLKLAPVVTRSDSQLAPRVNETRKEQKRWQQWRKRPYEKTPDSSPPE